jgi:hypothetical protein
MPMDDRNLPLRMGNRLRVKNDEVHWEEKLVNFDDDILYNPSGFTDQLATESL